MAGTLKADFTKRYGGGAVIRGEFERPVEGHSIGILFGPSGCGKTTVLRCLAGLERPEEGTIRFGEETWFDAAGGICVPPQQRGIGFVFQDYALFPHLTVRQNIGYGWRRLSARVREERLQEWLDRFSLRGLENQRPRQLSGGQQQRVALARALASRPRLLLLDEPLSALDAALRHRLRGELRQLLATCEVPVLVVTHDREEALALGDDLLVMSAGQVEQSGPVLEVFNRPATPEIAGIVGIETLRPGRIIAVREGLASVEVGGGVQVTALAPAEPVREVLVCIRGEDVILQRGGGDAISSVRNRLPARVVSIGEGLPLIRVELDAGFPMYALVTRAACEELGLRLGDEVTALVKAPAVHLIARGE